METSTVGQIRWLVTVPCSFKLYVFLQCDPWCSANIVLVLEVKSSQPPLLLIFLPWMQGITLRFWKIPFERIFTERRFSCHWSSREVLVIRLCSAFWIYSCSVFLGISLSWIQDVLWNGNVAEWKARLTVKILNLPFTRDNFSTLNIKSSAWGLHYSQWGVLSTNVLGKRFIQLILFSNYCLKWEHPSMPNET